jgi:uncharacterized membrane protein
MAALFPKKERVDGIARLGLSFILSIAVVAFIGFILSHTPLGIRIAPILFSIFTFVLIISIIAWWRRKKLTEPERFNIEVNIKFSGLGPTLWDQTLAIILVVAVLGAIGVVSYTLIKPKIKEAFTEFYVLGREGKATDYPTELKVGVKSSIILGITNHEGKEVSYRIEALIDGVKLGEVGPISLVDEQKSEAELSITPEKADDNQKLVFLLYMGDDLQPYLEPVFLWINVRN